MSTDELIARLVRDHRPVKRSSQPRILFAEWSAICLLFLAVGVLLIGARNDLAAMWRQSAFIVHTLIVFSVTVLAAAAAFKASIPDREQRFAVASLAVALAAWLAWLVAASVTASEPHAGSGWRCLRNIVVLAAPLGVLMYYMIGRAAPLRTGTAGWLATLSAASAADLATRFICRNDHAFHSLIWHFIPVLVLGCTGVILGRVVFRWEAADRTARS
ncbi:MAG TPA: NrsF family protein [Nitrospiraceae bacterium]|nr:NrsF family protein [Nitrospiraceae bacterium]